jgi:hypothetical protein
MTAGGPIPNRPERRITLPPGGRAARTVAIALVAVLIGWLAHSPGTKTVTRTMQKPPATIYQDTQAGAVAAVQAYFVQEEQLPSTAPFPRNRRGMVAGDWELGWRMLSYTASKAVVEAWGVEFQGGFGTSGQTWSFTDVPVTRQGGRWIAGGTPTSWSQGHRLVTINPNGATPPADNTQGGEDVAFGRLLWSLRRFPGAP